MENNEQTQTNQLPLFTGVCFNPEKCEVYGNYSDEISAYRAKKNWNDALTINFQLNSSTDYSMEITDTNHGTYLLTCTFHSSTSRYAFWKITNHQSPEVQYIIETAHIPLCDSRYDEIIRAPDMCSIYELPLVENPGFRSEFSREKSTSILKRVLDKVNQRS